MMQRMGSLVVLAEGTVFAGDFRVVRRLSAGGMGSVYAVQQLSTGRTRALKLMHPALVENAVLRGKFEQEARIGGRIASEHVVEVVAAGVDAGVPYLVMELLEGEDLAHAIARRGPFSPGEVVAIFEQMCHALALAHAAGIVHRDLKPENLFLATVRRAGSASSTVKVLDFGIARVAEEARGTSSTGAMGTPYWMAPEQTERKGAIGPPTDVWALGLVAFHLLTGRSFWKSAQDDSGSIATFVRELVLEPIPAATVRARELGIELLPAFDAWFVRCVNRTIGARFSDAGEAYQALADALGPPASGVVTGPTPNIAAILAQSSAVATVVPRSLTPAQLGVAHTVAAPSDEPHEPAPVPVGRFPAGPVFGVVALALLLGGGAVIAWFTRASGPSSLAGAEAGAAVVADCPDDMVSVPEGTVTIGSDDGIPDERPAHPVTLNAFCMERSEVTVEQYAGCTKAGACAAASPTVDWAGIKPQEHGIWDGYCNAGKPDRASHPINCVTHEQALAYCRFAARRLPTEEEWEYAARGTDGRVFPWGVEPVGPGKLNACGPECELKAGVLGLPLHALYSETDGFDGTSPVRSFPQGKSPFGVFDMAGNVSEWTSSHLCPYPGNNCSSDFVTTRGSSFIEDDLMNVKVFARTKDSPKARAASIGFRCVR